MQKLPSRVHFQPDPDSEQAKTSRRRSTAETLHLHARIQKLKRQGLSNLEIAEETGVTPTTVSKHLRGYIKSTNRAKRARR